MNRIITLIAFILFSNNVLFAQIDTNLSKKNVVEQPEVQAEFIGGEDELLKYIAINTIYPAKAQNEGIQGRVDVSFIICEDGSMCDYKILQSVSPELDEEAIRVLKTMPKWKPASVNSKPVSSQFTLPMSFVLQNRGFRKRKSKN
ncbi:MAG: energy transducer TonB [Chitinophagaceae bacterium]|nr:energy transducer TonB [Chitinophagaceae bacterium]